MDKLCKIRDIYRAIMNYEANFQKHHGICLNEGMLLCSLLERQQLSSGEIASLLGLTTSNTSKVIRSTENKELISRRLGTQDKRQMYFVLTNKGKKLITHIKGTEIATGDLIDSILCN